MTHKLTHAGRRLGVGVAAMGLAATGLIVASQGAVSAGGNAVPLSHFLCYTIARDAGVKAPAGIQLDNAIQPTPFTPTFGASTAHCNPANKLVPQTATNPTGLYASPNPAAHLQCWAIRSKLAAVKVQVGNQFGTGIFSTGVTPISLCLPTWKDTIAAVGTVNGAQPAGLDHFTCYPVKPIVGAYAFIPPKLVRAQDEFSPRFVRLKLARADVLCVPTVKILPTGASFPVQSPSDLSLLCFPTSPTPIWKPVYDQNQFGSSVIYLSQKNERFCLPSRIQVQPVTG